MVNPTNKFKKIVDSLLNTGISAAKTKGTSQLVHKAHKALGQLLLGKSKIIRALMHDNAQTPHSIDKSSDEKDLNEVKANFKYVNDALSAIQTKMKDKKMTFNPKF